jgi:hypothetical protein
MGHKPTCNAQAAGPILMNRPFPRIKISLTLKSVLNAQTDPRLILVGIDGFVHRYLVIHAGSDNEIAAHLKVRRDTEECVRPILVDILAAGTDAVIIDSLRVQLQGLFRR